jgi:hypothetical protein
MLLRYTLCGAVTVGLGRVWPGGFHWLDDAQLCAIAALICDGAGRQVPAFIVSQEKEALDNKGSKPQAPRPQGADRDGHRPRRVISRLNYVPAVE